MQSDWARRMARNPLNLPHGRITVPEIIPVRAAAYASKHVPVRTFPSFLILLCLLIIPVRACVRAFNSVILILEVRRSE